MTTSDPAAPPQKPLSGERNPHLAPAALTDGSPLDDELIQGERPTRVRYQVLAFICVLSFLTYFDRVCIMQAQPDIKKALSIDDEQMGVVLGAFFLAYSVFEIPGGWMGDRWGARVTLTRIVLMWSLFTALTGSATSLVTLVAFRFMFGMGEAGAYPNMARVQSQWLPLKTRARAGGMLWLVARWGGASAPLIFGFMVGTFDSPLGRSWQTAIFGQEFAGWRLAFWVCGLVGVVWCVFFYRWFRDDPALMPSCNAAEVKLIHSGRSTGGHGHQHVPGMWKALFSSPSLWALSFLYFFISFGWSFFVTWMPRYMESVHKVPFNKSGWMSFMPLFFGGIACLAGGILSDYVVRRTGWRRFGRAMFPVTGYIVAAASLYSLRWTETVEQVLFLITLAAFAADFGLGANWASIVDVGGKYAGSACGLVNSISNSGAVVQSLVGPYIFRNFGWDALMAVYACSILIAASMWLFINPTRTFYEE